MKGERPGRAAGPAVGWIMGLGVLIGVAYTLSPVTVVALVAFAGVIHIATKDADPVERRWLALMVGAGVALRLAAIAGLFGTTDHARVPFGFLFGDEELFIRRSIWMRNLAFGIPVHGADIVYAYDFVGSGSYVYVLALVHALLGASPYGVHVLNALLYVAGAVALYRLVRPQFGRPASLLGLGVLLFLPSLFIWSISGLKEPLFFAAMTMGLHAAASVLQGRTWARRLFAAVILAGVVSLAQTIREGGFVMAAAGIGGGVVVAFLLARPRLAVGTALVAVLTVPVVLTRPRAEDRIVHTVREAAKLHWGHIVTRGYVYKLLRPEFYVDRDASNAMSFHEGAQYVAGAFISYVMVPAPWQIRSRAMLWFWPEQSLWYALVVIVPIGIVTGLRRSVTVTCLLTMTALAAVAAVALTSGNIGTLVRHRGLALPYLVWLSSLGACELMFHSRKLRYAID